MSDEFSKENILFLVRIIFQLLSLKNTCVYEDTSHFMILDDTDYISKSVRWQVSERISKL